MNKNTILKISLTLLAVVAIVFAYRLINQPGGAETDGTITFVLKDQSGETVIDDQIDYVAKQEDGTTTTVLDIIATKYDVVCRNASTGVPDPECGEASLTTGGKVVLKVDEVETNFVNSYFAVYKNGEYATEGISQLRFKDGDRIELRYTGLD